MGVKFVKTFLLAENEKREVSEMSGKIMLWILEGQSVCYMAEQLNLPPWQVESNIDEMMYVLCKQVGKKRFIKTLFAD